MIIHNNTKLLNDQTVHSLYHRLVGVEGITVCPLGKITFKERLDGTIDATSEYVKHNWSLD